MHIEKYFQLDGDKLSFTRQQASDFAKNVAGDFNPIHDVDSKRFCVPGDLLFSVILYHYGLRQRMIFNFSGMVGDDNQLILPLCDSEHLALLDNKGKKYLAIECSGEVSNDAELIESLSRNYVEFSSAAFPHILQPLMQQHNVMINPDRPLIIYESMSFELNRLDIKHVKLELASSNLIVNGKRGAVTLEYVILGDGKEIGHGCKRMVLSGLREYDQAAMEQLMKDYAAKKR
jgi:hypothetical protein